MGGKACKTPPNFLKAFYMCKSTVAFFSTELPDK